MKHRDPKHATRQPTRTELENRIRRLEEMLNVRDAKIDRMQERLDDLQHRLDEIVKLARKP